MGSGDFTIEGWFNHSAFTSDANPADLFQIGVASNSYAGIRLTVNSSGKLFLLLSSNGSSWVTNVDNIGTAMSTGTWYHIALVKSGSTFTVYLDGTSQTAITQSATLYESNRNLIGFNNFSTARYFNGYIDDFRITKGIARYTSDFTPPTAVLLAKG